MAKKKDANAPEMVHDFHTGAAISEDARAEWIRQVRRGLEEEGPKSYAYARCGNSLVFGVHDEEGRIRIFEVCKGYREFAYTPALGIEGAAKPVRRTGAKRTTAKPGASRATPKSKHP